MTTTIVTQPYEPAIQAASKAINENASCRNRLIDGTSRTQNRATGLLDASNGIPYTILPFHTPANHNYQLSILSRDFWPITNVPRTDVLGLKIRKTCNVFSVFNRTKTGTYAVGFVKGKWNGLDKLYSICYVLAPTSKRPACSLLAAALLPVVPVSGAEQVTRTALDTLVCSLLLLIVLSNESEVSHV